uniref:Receptor-type tyrosine-protein phosphatase C n=1 Tax=Nothobranchius rachovii TaxID=451742 RepID=A0A1A8RX93_9TELE
MAGLRGPQTVLLWVMVIGLASCENKTTGENKPTAPTKPPPCSYNVTMVKFGAWIGMVTSPPGNYTINITENGEQVFTKKFIISSTNGTLTRIKHLKPCTEYQYEVTLKSDAEATITTCSRSTTQAKTNVLDMADIKISPPEPGSVCYESEWNLSSLVITPTKHRTKLLKNGTKVCFKLAEEDFCSDFNVSVTHEACQNFFFTDTWNITDDYLNLRDIKQTKPTELPAHINPQFPRNCKGLTAEYICSDADNVTRNLSSLEPFTNYSCTGWIKNSGVPINKTLPPVRIRIDCDFKIKYKGDEITNDSITLKWDTTSKNCQKVLSDLKELSYDCSCEGGRREEGRTNKRPDGGSCVISNLDAYTDYICTVHPKYKNHHDHGEKTEKKTKEGIPGSISGLHLTLPENNRIKVSCKNNVKFKGPKKNYKARLLGGPKNQDKENTQCDFEFKDLSFLTTYKVEVFAHNGKFAGRSSTDSIKTSYDANALIGFLVFLIILTTVALLLVLYKIYILKRRKSHDMNESMELIRGENDEENLLTVEPIAAEILLETYKRKLADEGRLFLAEFQSIPRIFSRYPVKEAKKTCNAIKNRYVDILPYDENRVQLTTGSGEAGSDYINASFIDGYKEPKKYIAAQGPKEETVGDFWRMIWEQQSSIIVMVTRCEEGNRVKCAQYWPTPERETEIFEEFIVKLTSEDHCPDYIIRRLSLVNKRDKNSEREITHIQFISWPDHGVPGEPHLLLKLRRRVNSFKNFFSGPIIVHCSAGVGRTGTYIGIDAMMEGLEAEGKVDIYGYVVSLRRKRCLMVQVEAQYILIHQALLEHNQFGETEISVSELHSVMSMLKQKSADSEPTLLEEEFERLPSFKKWRTFNTGITEENKKKNRSSIIPYDYNRVLLKMDDGHSHDSDADDEEQDDSSDEEEDETTTKYINASHIHGYWGSHALITAQTPLEDTSADFWLMVYQKRAFTIVMLSDCKEDSEPIYWSREKKTYGDIEVEVTSTDISPSVITRSIQIRHVRRKETRTVKHFQFLKWKGTELPEQTQDFMEMIKNIRHAYKDSGSQKGVPVVVHCDDGSSRSGIFCALWNLLDSADTEKMVDIFQVVKTLRKERQGMMSSLEQYQFLYSALGVAFPVQNGEVKPVKATAEADQVQVVNETESASKSEQPVSTTSNVQQAAAEITPPGADEEPSPPTESAPELRDKMLDQNLFSQSFL